MFAFDLPFLFFCGIILGYSMETNRITQKVNWVLVFSFLFVFQAGGILLWFNVLPGSKEFMIIPFNLFGLTTDDFEPLLSAFLFSFEPILIILGEFIGIRHVKPNKS
ncbi:MAG: hypothetical protein JSW11_14090 [Candidatus Heimdallarchaeota archaeon]|nr:MAG: hypothetical protein JSW11_14090 [Candidatus Heimdallarchaeota archaeon]